MAPEEVQLQNFSRTHTRQEESHLAIREKKKGVEESHRSLWGFHICFFFFGQQVGVIMKDCSKNEKDWCWFQDFWETNQKVVVSYVVFEGLVAGMNIYLMRPTLRVLQSGSREAVTGSSQEVPNMGQGPP